MLSGPKNWLHYTGWREVQDQLERREGPEEREAAMHWYMHAKGSSEVRLNRLTAAAIQEAQSGRGSKPGGQFSS
jgi:hypothetical protein